MRKRAAGDTACAKRRTRNMSFMSVTLDVSILSGLLNASADCRVERESCAKEATCVWAGRREKLEEGEVLLAPV